MNMMEKKMRDGQNEDRAVGNLGKRGLQRRMFLRGAGIALGLPWMESIAQNVQGAIKGGSQDRAIRTAFIYFPNGVWEKGWVPEGEGKDYTLSPSLEPLTEVKDYVNVFSGLDKKHSHGGDGHYAKTANFLTGMPVAKTTGRDVSSGGISVDQLIAQRWRGRTPLSSLELGTEPVISGIDSNVGYTRLYGSHISWQSAQRPVAKEINPRVVYERLFGKRGQMGQGVDEGSGGDAAKARLLDYILEDARDVRRRLGRDDQFKMDEYLDSVRAVEERIEYAMAHPDRDESYRPEEELGRTLPSGTPSDFREHIELMLDLMVLAFRSDSTRVCSLMFANDVSGRNFSFIDGVQGGHHELSHHENNQEKIAQYQKINRWHVGRFAAFLEKLRGVQEGEGTLLDQSLIVFGSSMSDGNRHDPDNLPILLGGKGGGVIQSGQHIRLHGEVPLCNLYLTLLNRIGLPTDSFGDSNSQIDLL